MGVAGSQNALTREVQPASQTTVLYDSPAGSCSHSTAFLWDPNVCRMQELLAS